MCLSSLYSDLWISIQWPFTLLRIFFWVYWTIKWPWFGRNPPIRWKEIYVWIFYWQAFLRKWKVEIDRHLVECVSGLLLLIRGYQSNVCLLQWNVSDGCIELKNDPVLEETRRLYEKSECLNILLTSLFTIIENRKSIDTLLNVSQVFIYCFMDTNSIYFFSETFLLGVVNKEMTLVWNKPADYMKRNVCLNILLTILFTKMESEK